MNKQTAVEWLFLMLNNPNKDQEFANKLLQKAKEMEKEQIIEAYHAGVNLEYCLDMVSPREYYEETYGGNKCHETK
jgi:hypothetical protein